MQQIDVPYEFLVRWNHETGALQGAHVKLFSTAVDATGAVVMRQEGDAQPVAMAGAIGFPLDLILTAINTGSIISMDEAVAARKVAEDALAAANLAHDALNASLTAAQNALKDANLQIAALTRAAPI